MEQNIISQKEFLEKYDAGQKVFENALMQFFDISSRKFDGLTIKNSKMFFCNFHNCELKEVTLEKCTLYYVNFYTGTASELLVESCDMEQTLLDVFSFEKTAFKKCNIRWSGILNSNIGSVDLSTSSKYKFFTALSQVTPQDIEEAISLVSGDIERLDLDMKLKVKQMIRQDMERYGLAMPEEKKGSGYGSTATDKATVTYGEVRHLLESTFGAYSQQNEYAMKSPYEKQDEQADRRKRTGPPF